MRSWASSTRTAVYLQLTVRPHLLTYPIPIASPFTQRNNLLQKDPPKTTETAAIWDFSGVRYSHDRDTKFLIFIYIHTRFVGASLNQDTRKIKYVLESNKKFIYVSYLKRRREISKLKSALLLITFWWSVTFSASPELLNIIKKKCARTPPAVERRLWLNWLLEWHSSGYSSCRCLLMRSRRGRSSLYRF